MRMKSPLMLKESHTNPDAYIATNCTEIASRG